MPAELTIGAFISKFWGAIAAFGFFIFSHIKLNEKVIEQSKRMDRIEKNIEKDLYGLKNSIKDLGNKVDSNHETTNNHIIDLLNTIKKG